MIALRFLRSLAHGLACCLVVASATSFAQETGTSREVSRFQEPTEERGIALDEDEDDEDSPGGSGPAESLEDELFLRERPDSLGASARVYREGRLAELLESREALVETRRAEAIRLLEEFISAEPETAVEMPDALLRLAELLWEKSRVDYLVAFAAWQEVPEANRGATPVPDYARPVALYDRILVQHPDFPRADLVLYMKAYALIERGESDGALALYRRILEEHPRSRFVADAHFALAESQFGAGQWAPALVEFELVMQHRESELYDISLFKSAWSLWRLGRTQDAALRFRQVLDLGRGNGAMSGAQRRRLRELQDEALDYLIQVFVEDENNTARDVFAFLEEIGGERYAQRVLVRLSDTYIGQSRYELGIEAYVLLLEMDPMAPDAAKYQREIASAYAALGESDKTIEAMEALASNYAPGSTWAQQQGDATKVAEEHARNERMIRRQALRYHELGQREDQRNELERAVALYGVYLEHFRNEEAAYEVEFYRSEILFHRLERFPEAGDGYLNAARANPQGEYTRDALYNAIGAFERVREVELERCAGNGTSGVTAPATAPREGAAGGAEAAAGSSAAGSDEGSAPAGSAPAGSAPAGSAPADSAPAGSAPAGGAGASPATPGSPCAESENDQKFSEAIELYVQLFPDDPDLPEILFRQGRLYYDRGIYDPAVRLFGQLLERFGESEYANPAGELILDSFNRAQDYANIETWARRLKSAPAFAAQEQQDRLDGLILQSIFKVGEQLAERGEHADAAVAFERAADEFPRDARASQALFNAGVERQRGGDPSGAGDAYDKLVERYPGTEVGARGAWAGAQMYESIAQFGDAARFYQSYGEHFSDQAQALDALYNAVLLRLTNGDHDEAIELGRSFVERHPRVEQTDDVYFFIGRAQEANEEWQDAATTYREYIRRSRDMDRQVEAQTRMGQVLLRAGDEAGAERAFTAAVRSGTRNRRRLTDGLYYAAQARSIQGDRVLAQYEAIEIAGPPEGLRERLQEKSELLQRAALIYANVVEFGVAEWVTASLFQIGRSFELFAEAMRAFEIPEGLSEDEEQVYMDQLAMFIIPMEERALDAFEGGYQRALELRIFNRWTAQLREALTRLNDVQYPPLRETGGDVVDSPPLPAPPLLGGLRRDEPTEAAE